MAGNPKMRSKRIKITEDKDSVKVDSHCGESAYDEMSSPRCVYTMYATALEKTLKNGYCNISERMKLSSPSKCLLNSQFCADNHFGNQDINFACHPIKFQMLLDNERPMLIVHLVNSMTMQNKFLDTNALLSLLEMILSINENSDTNGSYSAGGVIEGTMIAFLNILNAFPPCWTATTKTYRKLLLAPLPNDSNLTKNGFDNTQSLFMNIVGWMEQLILERSADVPDKCSSQESEDLNFYKWESKNTQRYMFQKLKRNDKIDRIFLVMGLMVQILEYDLSNWMMMYARCPKGRMCRSNEIPIIGRILWAGEEHRHVSFFVKRIIQLYIDYVSIDFCKDKIEILSRLINLMYTTLELCENKMSNEEIIYPYEIRNQYGCSRSDYFCQTVYQKLREHPAYDVNLYVKIIKSMQLPSVKHHLITKFVADIDNQVVTLNPKKIHSILIKVIKGQRSNDCDDNDGGNVNELDASGDYPFLKMVRKKYASSISNREYAELLLTALHAYADIYHFDEFKHHFAQHSNGDQQYIEELTKPNNPKLKKFNEMYMHKHGSKLIEKQKANAKDDRIYSHHVVNSRYSLHSVVKIFMSKEMAHRYRDDIKFYEIINLDESGVLKAFLKR